MDEKLRMVDFEEAKGIYNLNPGPSLRLLGVSTFAESLICLDSMLGKIWHG